MRVRASVREFAHLRPKRRVEIRFTYDCYGWAAIKPSLRADCACINYIQSKRMGIIELNDTRMSP